MRSDSTTHHLYFGPFEILLRLKVARIHKYPNPSSLASDELIALLKAGKNSDEVISAVKELLEIATIRSLPATNLRATRSKISIEKAPQY